MRQSMIDAEMGNLEKVKTCLAQGINERENTMTTPRIITSRIRLCVDDMETTGGIPA